MSAVDDLPPLRDVIRRHDLRAKKSLGQNFLLDLSARPGIAGARGLENCGPLMVQGRLGR